MDDVLKSRFEKRAGDALKGLIARIMLFNDTETDIDGKVIKPNLHEVLEVVDQTIHDIIMAAAERGRGQIQ